MIDLRVVYRRIVDSFWRKRRHIHSPESPSILALAAIGTDWPHYRKAFASDGSLRDILILDTTIAHWQAFIAFLQAGSYPLRFTSNGVACPLPPALTDLFSQWASHTPLLAIDVCGITLVCHFFAENTIELDFIPGYIHDADTARILLTFMQEIATALSRPIRLTPENEPDDPLFDYHPQTDIWFSHLGKGT